MQVSDRLVSVTGPRPQPYDTLANKTIVYFARRGIISVSYTGVAYLKGLPTDRWIAQTLSGLDLPPDRGTAFGIRICHPYDVGQAIEHLRMEAGSMLSQLPPSSRQRVLELHIIGSQWDRRHGRLRPVICKVTNKRTGNSTFEKLSTPRIWPINSSWWDLVSGTATNEARSYMKQRFNASGGLISPEHCIDVMVESIRQVSKSIPNIVGSDCMAVHIQGQSPRVTVSYRPQSEHRIRFGDNQPWIGPLAFSPYVISPNMAASPAISTNNLFMSTPDADIRFEGGPSFPLDQLPALQVHQVRPPQP